MAVGALLCGYQPCAHLFSRLAKHERPYRPKDKVELSTAQCRRLQLPSNQQASQHSLHVTRSSIFDEPIAARSPVDPDPSLVNEDFLPTSASERTFGVGDFAAFWVALVISITTYYLAASLVDIGMSWWQGVLTVFVGNIVTLLPMVLNAHAGTKYGIPFPVLARAGFGIKGANLPSLSRALVACGWFGIQTWVGGSAIHQLLVTTMGSALASAAVLPFLGITAVQFGCFMSFWALQVYIILKGVESIRVLEKYSAPILVALSLALLAWALTSAGGLGPMLSSPRQFRPGMPKEGQFWSVFCPAVTANVGYWATLSLNIPDFSRYAVSQRAQALGQALGLPFFMALFSFIGLAVTSATVVMYGTPITDPVQLLGRLEQPLAICVSLFGLILATLTTNVAANVVAPANAFVNLSPSTFSFKTGAMITAVLGVMIQPWRLMSSSGGFVNWLVGYSAIVGPMLGVVLTDYYVVRGRTLLLDDLYSMDEKGQYWYQGGWNVAALIAVVVGVLPSLPGLLASCGVTTAATPFFRAIYDCAWFVGVAVSSVLYAVLMARGRSAREPGAGGQAGAAAASAG